VLIIVSTILQFILFGIFGASMMSHKQAEPERLTVDAARKAGEKIKIHIVPPMSVPDSFDYP
jgi:hypothetical protein